MSVSFGKVFVGGLWMELRESPGATASRYTLVFGIASDPTAVSITYLGDDRAAAMRVFARKVETHRTMVGAA